MIVKPFLRIHHVTAEIIIILPLEEEEEVKDLLMASESSLNFWDNPIDDEIWNEV
jgi:hypothetical protein